MGCKFITWWNKNDNKKLTRKSQTFILIKVNYFIIQVFLTQKKVCMLKENLIFEEINETIRTF